MKYEYLISYVLRMNSEDGKKGKRQFGRVVVVWSEITNEKDINAVEGWIQRRSGSEIVLVQSFQLLRTIPGGGDEKGNKDEAVRSASELADALDELKRARTENASLTRRTLDLSATMQVRLDKDRELYAERDRLRQEVEQREGTNRVLSDQLSGAQKIIDEGRACNRSLIEHLSVMREGAEDKGCELSSLERKYAIAELALVSIADRTMFGKNLAIARDALRRMEGIEE